MSALDADSIVGGGGWGGEGGDEVEKGEGVGVEKVKVLHGK